MPRPKLLVLAMLLSAAPAAASEPQAVSIRAADGLVLRGTWHQADAVASGRVVLLLHEMCGNRAAWEPFLDRLHRAGIDALAVDLRGFGETGGAHDFAAQVSDAKAWLAWIRAQRAAQRVGVMGESLGAKLAIVACARDPGCRAVAALSPYGELAPADLDFRERAVFLVGTRGDDVHSALAVRRMAADVQGDVTIRLVAGSEPGVATALEHGGLVEEAVAWLDRHL
jgi:alpha-beta hydrolase superfamily lysophospholipase